MPAPRRPRPPQPAARKPAPIVPLGTVIREFEAWRSAQTGKPSRGALRDYWQKQDAQHAQRPDYALWRELHGADSPPQRRQAPAELALRALKSPESAILWAALALLPDVLELPALSPAKKDSLLQTLRQRLSQDRPPLLPLPKAPLSSALVLWQARSLLGTATWTELQALLQTATPGWKPGRKTDLGFWDSELPWPVASSQITRRLASTLHRQILRQLESKATPAADLAPWHITAWMLHRDARPAQGAVRGAELETLLAAASTARLAGDADQAARLAALVLHLLPPQAPDSFLQRCRVAAWHLSEMGLCGHPALQIPLEDLPFPGDLPTTKNGQAAARQYLDPQDAAHPHLTSEVQNNPDWDVLRRAGIVLHHPLAALSWVARKAQAYALKKQHELLQSAATLAARHHRLITLGRLLPHLPPAPERILGYAKTLRQSQRRMPFLREQEIWQDWTKSLRTAWSRLEPEAIHDAEDLFLLHETLHDREVTLLRVLPDELQTLALRHLHSRSQPSPLVQALVADPRQMQQLEHQRQVELWSVAAELRERPELAPTAWISLVMRGEAAQGRYSLIVQGPSGRVIHHDRLKPQSSTPGAELDWTPLLETLTRAIAQTCPQATQLWVAADAGFASLPWAQLPQEIFRVPSWEWAFRVLREPLPSTIPPGTYLRPDRTTSIPEPSPAQPLPSGTCVLLPLAQSCDANTRWLGLEAATEEKPAPALRSLQVGTYDHIISAIPVQHGDLKQDLVRVCLAHQTRTFLSPVAPLADPERTAFLAAPLTPPATWIKNGLPTRPAPKK